MVILNLMLFTSIIFTPASLPRSHVRDVMVGILIPSHFNIASVKRCSTTEDMQIDNLWMLCVTYINGFVKRIKERLVEIADNLTGGRVQ